MMRFLIPAAALALFAVQAQAQTTTTPAPIAPATTAPAMTTPASPAMPMKKTNTHRVTLQQRFDKINASHDGHLTKDQATAGKWGYVAHNFDVMDKDRKGYVTVDDIHAYAKARHATSHKAPAATPAPATNG